jgi:hypothetical protein
MYPKLLSFLYVSRSKQQSTHQCYILAVHDVTESVLVRGDCRSSARPRGGCDNRGNDCRSDKNRSCASGQHYTNITLLFSPYSFISKEILTSRYSDYLRIRRTEIRFPAGSLDSPPLRNVQTASGAQPDFHSVYSGSSIHGRGCKAAGA